MTDLNTLLAGLLAAGMAGGLVLLTAGIRGTVPDPTRPPSRTTDWWLALRRSPRECADQVTVSHANRSTAAIHSSRPSTGTS